MSAYGFSFTAIVVALPAHVAPTSATSLFAKSPPASSSASSPVFTVGVSGTAALGLSMDTLGMFGQELGATCMALGPESAAASVRKDVISLLGNSGATDTLLDCMLLAQPLLIDPLTPRILFSSPVVTGLRLWRHLLYQVLQWIEIVCYAPSPSTEWFCLVWGATISPCPSPLRWASPPCSTATRTWRLRFSSFH